MRKLANPTPKGEYTTMKRETTCKEVLYRHIQATESWIKKASLYLVAEDWLAETVGRALRDLEENNFIKKSYYDGKYAKGLVQYARLGTVGFEKLKKVEVKIITKEDGSRVAVVQ